MNDKKRILVVDDFAYIRMLFKKSFQNVPGYEVITVENGKEALMKLSDSINPIDLILLDINLPDINGINLLKGIRKSKLNTKVIIITAYSNEDLIKNVKGLNVLKIFSKPIVIEQLLGFVNEVFGGTKKINPVNKNLKNVLIVDDVNRIISLISKTLENKDLTFDTFTDGYEAMSNINHNHKKYDLAILDYRLQGIDGIELAIALKKVNPSVIIVIMTAFPDKNLLIKCKEHNISNIFRKPLEMTKFKEKIYNLLKLK